MFQAIVASQNFMYHQHEAPSQPESFVCDDARWLLLSGLSYLSVLNGHIT